MAHAVSNLELHPALSILLSQQVAPLQPHLFLRARGVAYFLGGVLLNHNLAVCLVLLNGILKEFLSSLLSGSDPLNPLLLLVSDVLEFLKVLLGILMDLNQLEEFLPHVRTLVTCVYHTCPELLLVFRGFLHS